MHIECGWGNLMGTGMGINVRPGRLAWVWCMVVYVSLGAKHETDLDKGIS